MPPSELYYRSKTRNKSANAVRHQLGDLSRKIDAVVQPVYTSQKIKKEEKKKKKKSYYNTGYSYLVTHPSTSPTEQGLQSNQVKRTPQDHINEFII